jgi:hypothetical protein
MRTTNQKIDKVMPIKCSQTLQIFFQEQVYEKRLSELERNQSGDLPDIYVPLATFLGGAVHSVVLMAHTTWFYSTIQQTDSFSKRHDAGGVEELQKHIFNF